MSRVDDICDSMKSSEKSSTSPGTKSDRSLNDREIAILRLLAEGYTSARIAAELSLSTETIRWYRKKAAPQIRRRQRSGAHSESNGFWNNLKITNHMKKTTREYLAPETEVINMTLEGVIAMSGVIEDSGENPVVDW